MDTYHILIRADGTDFRVQLRRPLSLGTRRLLRQAQQQRWSIYAQLQLEFKELFDHLNRPPGATETPSESPSTGALPPHLIDQNFQFAERWGDAEDFFVVRQFQSLIVRTGLAQEDAVLIDSEVGGPFWALQDMEMMEAEVARFLGGDAPARSRDRHDARGVGHQQPEPVERPKEATGGAVVIAGSCAGVGEGPTHPLAGL